MCNLYSVTKGQQAIIDLVRAMRDLTGNMPPLPAIFPNCRAPVVRVAPDDKWELLMRRWASATKDWQAKGPELLGEPGPPGAAIPEERPSVGRGHVDAVSVKGI